MAEAIQGFTPETGSIGSPRLSRIAGAFLDGEQDDPARGVVASRLMPAGDEAAREAMPPLGEDRPDEPDEVCLAAFAQQSEDATTPSLDPCHIRPAAFDPRLSRRRPRVRPGSLARNATRRGTSAPGSTRLTC
ncbi:hypothetical protein [Aquisphaera giovannonii]|uniref:hypothetical protein n=1 Tax=Aquisphaera giovannonii TaxID=406548 RepID=UPI0011DF787B|nr:hypothetical protein [Aquisphaera giovannonii]